MANDFVPCKHLDHNIETYGGTCTLVQLPNGIKHWHRNYPPYPEAPVDVQFCGLGRGRINSIYDCVSVHGNPARMSCHEAAKEPAVAC